MTIKRTILAVAATAAMGMHANAANVVVFDDPAFVDSGPFGTSTTVKASLTHLGHTVTTFTGTTEADWSTCPTWSLSSSPGGRADRSTSQSRPRKRLGNRLRRANLPSTYNGDEGRARTGS